MTEMKNAYVKPMVNIIVVEESLLGDFSGDNETWEDGKVPEIDPEE